MGQNLPVLAAHSHLSSFQKLWIEAGIFCFLFVHGYYIIGFSKILNIVDSLQHVQLGPQCFPLEDGGRSDCTLWRLLLLSCRLDQLLCADHLVENYWVFAFWGRLPLWALARLQYEHLVMSALYFTIYAYTFYHPNHHNSSFLGADYLCEHLVGLMHLLQLLHLTLTALTSFVEDG